jgi:two-component system nitrate/nitrite response regulator NarL
LARRRARSVRRSATAPRLGLLSASGENVIAGDRLATRRLWIGRARWGRAVKFLVIDDHALVRHGLAAVLRGIDPDAPVLEAGDCASALALAAAHSDIGLALLDLMMPDAVGLTAVARFVAACPATPLMVVSSSEAPADVRAALALGALGYVAKTANASTLAAAIRMVLSGEVYVPPFMARANDGEPAPAAAGALTARQQAVLALIRQGASNKEIADELGVTEGTVKVHLTTIYRVLGVANRAEARRQAET